MAIRMLRNATSRRSIDTTTTPTMRKAAGRRERVEVDVRRCPAADMARCRCLRSERHHVVARGVDQVLRGVSCGPVVGSTVISAASPAGLICGRDTSATPGVAQGRSATARRPAGVATGTGLPRPSGAARAGTEALGNRSYPARWNCLGVVTRVRDREVDRRGTARRARQENDAPAAASAPCRCTSRLQRSQPRAGTTCPSAEIRAVRRCPIGSRSRSMRRPR